VRKWTNQERIRIKIEARYGKLTARKREEGRNGIEGDRERERK
jgi:hypothetical protein